MVLSRQRVTGSRNVVKAKKKNNFRPLVKGQERSQFNQSECPNVLLYIVHTAKSQLSMFHNIFLLESDRVRNCRMEDKVLATLCFAMNIARTHYSYFPSFLNLTQQQQFEFRHKIKLFPAFEVDCGSDAVRKEHDNSKSKMKGPLARSFIGVIAECLNAIVCKVIRSGRK